MAEAVWNPTESLWTMLQWQGCGWPSQVTCKKGGAVRCSQSFHPVPSWSFFGFKISLNNHGHTHIYILYLFQTNTLSQSPVEFFWFQTCPVVRAYLPLVCRGLPDVLHFLNVTQTRQLRTGCGKTLAFVLPVVERMRANKFIKQSRKKAPEIGERYSFEHYDRVQLGFPLQCVVLNKNSLPMHDLICFASYALTVFRSVRLRRLCAWPLRQLGNLHARSSMISNYLALRAVW